MESHVRKRIVRHDQPRIDRERRLGQLYVTKHSSNSGDGDNHSDVCYGQH